MKDILQNIVRRPEIESRWLNTLSLLEHIGARKISRTVCDKHPSLAVLEHFADESRHAYAFKRLSQELAGGPCEDYLCPQAAIQYFQTLDREISDWITRLTGSEDAYQNYLFTTNMIERRAMKLYPLYKSVTQDTRVREELQTIILEETDHMHPIEDQCKAILSRYGVADFAELAALEEGLFQEFCAALQAKLAH